MDQAVKTSTETLIKVLYVLVDDIQSEDGVANAAILEAAQRLEELYKENIELKRKVIPSSTVRWVVLLQ